MRHSSRRAAQQPCGPESTMGSAAPVDRGRHRKKVVGGIDRQVTSAPHGHVLTNAHVWSPDSKWLTFDVRSDAGGARFDGDCIMAVNHRSGQVRTLYTAPHDARCGVSMFRPGDGRERTREVVFIHGPERPSKTWTYGPARRRGVLLDVTSLLDKSTPSGNTSETTRSPAARNLDARDLLPPFTPGALRGGTHVHQFSPDGVIVSSTYEDHVLMRNDGAGSVGQRNHRGVALTVLDGLGGVRVTTASHPRNHSGEGFTVLATKHEDDPTPGGDGIMRAVEEAWIGDEGYDRGGGGGWQRRSLAFLGEVTTSEGAKIMELFVLDLPENPSALREASGPAAPLQGTSTLRPCPPHGVVQRRLTDTTRRARPGLSQGGATGPRFWPRSSRCGSLVAVVALDDEGTPQLFTVRTAGDAAGDAGGLRQVTRLPSPGVESAFTWHPAAPAVAFVHDGSVCVVDVPPPEPPPPRGGASAERTREGGRERRSKPRREERPERERERARGAPRAYDGVVRLTRRRTGEGAPRPEACVFSPCGRYVAYVRRVLASTATSAPAAAAPATAATSTRARIFRWIVRAPRRMFRMRLWRRPSSAASSAASAANQDRGVNADGRTSGDGEGKQRERVREGEREEGEWHNQVCVVALKWGSGADRRWRWWWRPSSNRREESAARGRSAKAARRMGLLVDDAHGCPTLSYKAVLTILIAAVVRFAAVRKQKSIK